MKYIFAVACFLSLISCVENSSPQKKALLAEITAPKFSEMSTSKQKEFARTKIETYCNTLHEDGFYQYCAAVVVEYYQTKLPEHGAFENINISKTDTGWKAETSIITINSASLYNLSESGELNIIGMNFEMNDKGDVLSHGYYVSFIKDGKEKFYYTDLPAGYKISDLLK